MCRLSYMQIKTSSPYCGIQEHNVWLSIGEVEVCTYLGEFRGVYWMVVIIGGGGHNPHNLCPWLYVTLIEVGKIFRHQGAMVRIE